ncbi:hypothetical protein EXN66_Car004159 [Channa argus]|uniref:Uncharacterized protein n=1 Tax=Channa argus TaxID=215402 RepID=A0A6G1PE25_CHAAH|nr:hypothetical protein EXN66_Car004159 [Channa argus]
MGTNSFTLTTHSQWQKQNKAQSPSTHSDKDAAAAGATSLMDEARQAHLNCSLMRKTSNQPTDQV